MQLIEAPSPITAEALNIIRACDVAKKANDDLVLKERIRKFFPLAKEIGVLTPAERRSLLMTNDRVKILDAEAATLIGNAPFKVLARVSALSDYIPVALG